MKRTLAEFGALSAAERKLRDGLCDGEGVILGDGQLPGESAGPERQVRAGFLRYLILGGCASLPGPVPENGVRVMGARIIGTLDLEGARIPRDVGLINCRFEAAPNLRSARIDNLNLIGSTLPGLVADRLRAEGNVFLRNAEVAGEVRLVGAKLGGDLDCIGALFTAGKEGKALNADRLQADGGVFLRNAKVAGEVRLVGAKLGGDLDCDGALFTAGEGDNALFADGLQADGGVFLRNAEVAGEVRLPGAKLGGDLSCTGARLSAGKDGKALFADGLQADGDVFLRDAEVAGEVRLVGAKLGGDLSCTGARLSAGKEGKALNAGGAEIGGTLFLRGAARIDRALDLTAARIGGINDDETCWPNGGNLLLDRCRYGAFTGQAPVTAEARIRWLDLQDPARWGLDFWPQPWEHCARVLREMGHTIEARAVLIAKEKRQRADRRARLRREHLYEDAGWYWVWDGILGLTVRYGRQPLLAFFWLFAFWALGAVMFQTAATQDAIKPNNPFVLRSAEWAACHPGYDPPTDSPAHTLRWAADYPSQLACFLDQPEAQGYPRFNAAVYSADTLLPIVAMEMQEFWIPDEAQGTRGAATRVYLWVHIAMGWALSLLAVAGFSGLIKTDGSRS